MYVYARKRTGDAMAAWLGGLLFGFSPFMSARTAEHFSLTLAAPLPIFGWLMYRLYPQPTMGLACAAGATVAWAFLCDVYYAVYCLMWAGYGLLTMVSVETRPATVRRIWPRALVDLATSAWPVWSWASCFAAAARWKSPDPRELHAAGHARADVDADVVVRAWMAFAVRPRLARACRSSHAPTGRRAAVCLGILSPVLSATAFSLGQRNWITPQIWWRNSAPGVDLLAFFAPNPLHPWSARYRSRGYRRCRVDSTRTWHLCRGCARDNHRRGGLVGFPPAQGWVVFTGFFACLALGPFLAVAQQLTYVPTPWALLRYLPMIGAARTPTRLTILVMLGVAMLLVMAVQHCGASRAIRGWCGGHRRLAALRTASCAANALFGGDPGVYRIVAADPRPIRVLSLPFGLRDGLSSRGNYSSARSSIRPSTRSASSAGNLAPARRQHRSLSAEPDSQGAPSPERGDTGRTRALPRGAATSRPQPSSSAGRLRRRRHEQVLPRAHRVRA